MRRVIPTTLILLAVAGVANANTAEQWLEDFHFILAEISSHYANLDSVIEDRRVDLPGVRKRTEDRIRAARDDIEAQRAIEWFMSAFGDGHAYVRWAGPPAPAGAVEAKPLCQRLGYVSRDFGGINFGRLDDYVPIEDADAAYFPGGVLAGRTGIVRIHDFSETAHPALCSAAVAALQLSEDAQCESDCPWRVRLRTADLLTAALERRLKSLQKAGARSIVVDITRNGGGSDWVEPAARVMTPVPLKGSRMAFVRHPHWVSQLEQRAADVSGNERAVSVFSRAAKEAGKPCDRSGLWADPPKQPGCSQLVVSEFYATGFLPYAKPGSLDGIPNRNVLFNPSQYRYKEGTNRLPLTVLVDGGTASAAEYFAAILQDNKAAKIVGLPTRGSGCGHTNGGIFVNLPNSRGRLALPDCARMRADGSNEVLGVMPDVLVPWRDFDSAHQRAARAAAVLLRPIR
ncbi:MAG TPA: S41 family peptidase [Thermoanaerobaculia bacterium]|nr:S41 family peptidase [Thermoanaerobaculia bacterium]